MSHIAFDVETYFSTKLKYSLRNQIVEQYVTHELFDCYIVSVSDGQTCWAGHPRDFNWAALDGKTLVSHNARFDRNVYAELVRRGLAPKLNIPAWKCSANLTSYICNRRALDPAVEYLYKVRLDKSVRADAKRKEMAGGFYHGPAGSDVEIRP